MFKKFFFAILLSLILAAPVFAKVNINTAGATELDTIPEVGPSTAAKIILYREVNGLFAKIEDVMKVSGIKEATFAKMKDFIAVGDSTGDSSNNNTENATTADNFDAGKDQDSTATLGGGISSHENPVELSDFDGSVDFKIGAGRKRLTAVGSPVKFEAVSSGDSGKARFLWSFGDGGQRSGRDALHTYYAPGVYNVVVNGESGEQSAVAKTQVEVFVPELTLGQVDPRAGLVPIINSGGREINLGGWQLIVGNKTFTLPSDTIVGAKSQTIIPTAISGLPLLATSTNVLVILQNPVRQVISQVDDLAVQRRKIEALQNQLGQLQTQLAQLKPELAPKVTPLNPGSQGVTFDSPNSILEAAPLNSDSQGTTSNANSVIELPRKTGWWGSLVKKVLP